MLNNFQYAYLVADLGFFLIWLILFFNHIFKNIIQSWWSLKNISGILVAGVPIEEIMWGFSWGFVAGPSYEFLTGSKLKRR